MHSLIPPPVTSKTIKKHRNSYNTAVRQSKTSYYETNLANSRYNPKKTWQLLKEAANLDSARSPITELNVNCTLTSDNSLIANSFNTFFSTVGSTISNSIPPISVNPLDYCTTSPDIRNLEFAGTGPCQVGDTIKLLTGKSSTDLDGVSTKLLKAVRAEIESPLAHIFNLSLTTGEFNINLRLARLYLYIRLGTALTLITTDQ